MGQTTSQTVGGSGAVSTVQEPPWAIYHIDDCMYVAALSEGGALPYTVCFDAGM